MPTLPSAAPTEILLWWGVDDAEVEPLSGLPCESGVCGDRCFGESVGVFVSFGDAFGEAPGDLCFGEFFGELPGSPKTAAMIGSVNPNFEPARGRLVGTSRESDEFDLDRGLSAFSVTIVGFSVVITGVSVDSFDVEVSLSSQTRGDKCFGDFLGDGFGDFLGDFLGEGFGDFLGECLGEYFLGEGFLGDGNLFLWFFSGFLFLKKQN